MVELVAQHGKNLACGGLSKGLACFTLFWGGEKGDAAGERIHDFGNFSCTGLGCYVGQIGDGSTYRDTCHCSEIAAADIEIHQTGAGALSELRCSHECNRRCSHTSLGAHYGGNRALATRGELFSA